MSRKEILNFHNVQPLSHFGEKALVSHHFEQRQKLTGDRIEFVVLVPKDGQRVSDYLTCAHVTIPFEVIEKFASQTEDYDNTITLLGLESELSDPFTLINADLLQEDNTHSQSGNWTNKAVTHIENPETFWDSLQNTQSLAETLSIIPAISDKTYNLSTASGYSDALSANGIRQADFDFSKPNEDIYFQNGRVIKYFADPKIISARVKRGESLKGLVPLIDRVGYNHYSYKMVEGQTIYESLVPGMTTDFLNWCQQNLWNPQDLKLDAIKHQDFIESCHKFYKDKTLERVKLYWQTSQTIDENSIVNGTPTPTLSSLLEKIDWNYLSHGVASRFHGDLQFDNVLYTQGGQRAFTLLDWRHEFAGLTHYADMYYDLAKLYGGLITPYSSIKKNLFTYNHSGGVVTLSVDKPNHLDIAKKEFEEFVAKQGYDMHKIELLTGIIFINMSPLHTHPFNLLLHHLGKKILTEVI